MVFNPKNSATVGIVAFLTSYVLYGYCSSPSRCTSTLEFVKVCQAMVFFLNNDRGCTTPEGDTPRPGADEQLNEELGMVHTVLSDKTDADVQQHGFLQVLHRGRLVRPRVDGIERSIAKIAKAKATAAAARDAAPAANATGRARTTRGGGRGVVEPGRVAIGGGFNFTDERVEDGRVI